MDPDTCHIHHVTSSVRFVMSLSSYENVLKYVTSRIREIIIELGIKVFFSSHTMLPRNSRFHYLVLCDLAERIYYIP